MKVLLLILLLLLSLYPSPVDGKRMGKPCYPSDWKWKKLGAVVDVRLLENHDYEARLSSRLQYYTRRISSAWRPPEKLKKYALVVAFSLTPSAQICGVRILKSSGINSADNCAVKAIESQNFKLPAMEKEINLTAEFKTNAWDTQ